MTDPARRVLEQALRLSSDERARIALALMESLGEEDDEPATVDQPAIDRAWAEEIGRRVRRVIENGERGAPAEEVLARLRKKHGIV